MNRISVGPPLGPISKGQTNALNHCELMVDGISNGLLLKTTYPPTEEGVAAELYEWRGLRPIGTGRITWAAAMQWDTLIEHMETALAFG